MRRVGPRAHRINFHLVVVVVVVCQTRPGEDSSGGPHPDPTINNVCGIERNGWRARLRIKACASAHTAHMRMLTPSAHRLGGGSGPIGWVGRRRRRRPWIFCMRRHNRNASIRCSFDRWRADGVCVCVCERMPVEFLDFSLSRFCCCSGCHSTVRWLGNMCGLYAINYKLISVQFAVWFLFAGSSRKPLHHTHTHS